MWRGGSGIVRTSTTLNPEESDAAGPIPLKLGSYLQDDCRSILSFCSDLRYFRPFYFFWILLKLSCLCQDLQFNLETKDSLTIITRFGCAMTRAPILGGKQNLEGKHSLTLNFQLSPPFCVFEVGIFLFINGCGTIFLLLKKKRKMCLNFICDLILKNNFNWSSSSSILSNLQVLIIDT